MPPTSSPFIASRLLIGRGLLLDILKIEKILLGGPMEIIKVKVNPQLDEFRNLILLKYIEISWKLL